MARTSMNKRHTSVVDTELTGISAHETMAMSPSASSSVMSAHLHTTRSRVVCLTSRCVHNLGDVRLCTMTHARVDVREVMICRVVALSWCYGVTLPRRYGVARRPVVASCRSITYSHCSATLLWSHLVAPSLCNAPESRRTLLSSCLYVTVQVVLRHRVRVGIGM